MVFLPSMQSFIVLQAHVCALFASDARFAMDMKNHKHTCVF